MVRKDTREIKSESFKEFLHKKGYDNISQWKKVMETWMTEDGELYERHYWTDGVHSFYHE